MKEVAPERPLRSKNIIENRLLETGKSVNSKKTFITDGVKLWNRCPASIRQCDSLFSAKKEIKKFVNTLPV